MIPEEIAIPETIVVPKRVALARLNAFAAVAVLTALPISGSHLAAQDEEPENTAAIIGHVVDAQTETLLAGVWVSVEGSDWGSFTNNEGRFLLPEVEAGSYVIVVAHLGYETVSVGVEWTEFGAPVQIRMEPDPILLEGLEIVTDRFRQRRRAAATSVRAFELEELTNSTSWSIIDFLASRALVALSRCDGRYSDMCARVRGWRTQSFLYVDEMPIFDGWAFLQTLAPHDLYMVEVYNGGRQIRAYSHPFMERAAGTRLFPLPLPR